MAGLEPGTYISDLNINNPEGTDPKSAGDAPSAVRSDRLRLREAR